MKTLSQFAIASWGVVGVLALLSQAVYRLTPFALEPIAHGTMTATQVSIYAGWVVTSAYFEGYRAFQKRFSPRVAARALHLSQNPRPLWVLLAPVFCMSFFHATPRGKAVAWGTTTMVVCFILTLRHVPQPWRGIVDGGVVVALTWGIVALLVFFARGVVGQPLPVAPDLPDALEETIRSEAA